MSYRRFAAARSASRPAAPGGDPSRPVRGASNARRAIMVVGDAMHTEAVVARLRRNWRRVESCPTIDDALGAARGRARAYVLVSLSTDSGDEAKVQRLTAAAPVFVVVSAVYSDVAARRLYTAGAQGVIEWPHDALLLPRLIRARLASGTVAAPKPDRAAERLARAIRTRLKLSALPLRGLQVEVDRGVVELTGYVASVSCRASVVRRVAHVPGVQEVRAEGLQIDAEPRDDQQLERAVDRAVREVFAAGRDPQSSTEAITPVSCAVDDGVVVMVGTVAQPLALEEVLSAVGHVEGVRAIRNFITVSPTGHRNAMLRAREVGQRLEQEHPQSRVDVTCVGKVAVVRGQVPRAADQEEIVELVREQDGIERVVAKLRPNVDAVPSPS